MISIVTGTLNRKHLLPGMISNTVDANENLELVLVDGGSTDGTIEFLEHLAHPRIKLIKVGKRTSYPHFINLGIRSATHDLVCQWNDDVLLLNNWEDVIKEVKDENFDSWIFSWQYVPLHLMNDHEYQNSISWNLCNQKDTDPQGEIVVNYGIFRKDVFRKYGLFDTNFLFYYADGELPHRLHACGVRFKNCSNIKVASIQGVPKLASSAPDQWEYYLLCRQNHLLGKFQTHLEFLS